jgi:hypothetical protein
MLAVFVCDACPLAFQVGGYVYWDCSGRQEQVVCYRCGTMHRLVQEGKVCRVFALAGPLRDAAALLFELAGPGRDAVAVPVPESAWRVVGKAQGIDAWRRLRCSACRQVGQLRSLERLPRQAEWPEDPVCPLCRGPLRCVSCIIIG